MICKAYFFGNVFDVSVARVEHFAGALNTEHVKVLHECYAGNLFEQLRCVIVVQPHFAGNVFKAKPGIGVVFLNISYGLQNVGFAA